MIRLSANFHTIFSYFHQLYPLRDDVWDHLGTLVNRLADAYEKRPVALRKMDRDRELAPDWFLSEKLAGMMLYVDRFANDLQGFQKKIPYFDKLGINLIHLMPLLKCPKENNDGGYAVSNYREVNPELGSMDDIRKIAKILHQQGKYLMLDLAINHTSNEHEWAQKAIAGEREYQDFYYFYDNRHTPDQFEQSMPQVFPETAPGNFTYVPELNKWVMSVFHDYQWDLNFSNPKVFIEMLDNLLFLANQGVDILRLDALAFTWKKLGTSCQNLDEAHLLLQTLKACAQVVAPGTIFLAEAIVAPHEIVKYFGDNQGFSNECDLAYNATLMTLLWESIATKNNRLLHISLSNVPGKPLGTTWLNYVRCHDDIGLGYEDYHATLAGYDASGHRRFIIDFLTGAIDWSFASGRPFMEDKKNGDARISGSLASLAGLEKALRNQDEYAQELAFKRIILLHAIIMAFGGIPLLYMGDELGLINDYSYEQDKKKAHDNRWMHRPKMDWDLVKNVDVKGTLEYNIFQSISKMITVRRQSPEFRDANNLHIVDSGNQHLFVFVRYWGKHRSMAVFNLNDHREFLHVDVLNQQNFIVQSGLKDKYTGAALSCDWHGLELAPYQFYWITQA
ncbi:MAG: alpha-amylase family protein [Cyclobacteriaceae bacterium]|nr:alpha-amylase family protein [Cyclobacteriaceae bacterium HetDA_MAG_MS6]